MKKIKIWLLLFSLLLTLSGCSNAELQQVLAQLEQTETANQTISVPEGELEVHFLDVGQADCSLLASNGHYMLIDGGNEDDAQTILSYLRQMGVERLDIVIGTHPHEDHVGSLDEVIKAFAVEAVYLPDVSADTRTYRQVLEAAADKGLEIQHLQAGDVLDFQGLPVEIFGPVEDYGNNLNNWSVVLRISVGEVAFLFTGDAEQKAEYDILEAGYDISSDVLKVGHHGSNTSNAEEFLSAADADYAVISAGGSNMYGHPTAEILERLEDFDAELYRTDEQGTIVCKTDGRTVSFHAQGKVETPSEQKALYEADYIGNVKSMKFHTQDCSSLPDEDNRLYLESREEAIAAGFSPCGSCKP